MDMSFHLRSHGGLRRDPFDPVEAGGEGEPEVHPAMFRTVDAIAGRVFAVTWVGMIVGAAVLIDRMLNG